MIDSNGSFGELFAGGRNSVVFGAKTMKNDRGLDPSASCWGCPVLTFLLSFLFISMSCHFLTFFQDHLMTLIFFLLGRTVPY